jgi:hypothetical protein
MGDPPPTRVATTGHERVVGHHGAGVMLLPGQYATLVSVDGTVSYSRGDPTRFGATGSPGRWEDYRYDDVRDLNHGALAILAFGDVYEAKPNSTFIAPSVGCLSFFINDTDPDNPTVTSKRMCGSRVRSSQ